jgi:hypothetical protein
MAITEESRHELYQRLEEVLDAEHAATLMEHLPPVGWADVATKRDVDVVRGEMRHEFAMVRGEIQHNVAALRIEMHAMGDQLRAEWRREIVRQTWALVTANAAFAAVVVAAIRL